MSRRPTPIKVSSNSSTASILTVAATDSNTKSKSDNVLTINSLSSERPLTPPRNLPYERNISPVISPVISPSPNSKRMKFTRLPVEITLLSHAVYKVFGFFVVNGYN